MTERKRVSVVMPAYNEEAIIGAILERVSALEQVDEIVVVDDGSTDGTPAVVAAYDKVKLVRHPYNLGNGAAVKSGIRTAQHDVILLMDSDGQHPPEEIPNLLQHINHYEMVVGARTAASEAQQQRRIQLVRFVCRRLPRA